MGALGYTCACCILHAEREGASVIRKRAWVIALHRERLCLTEAQAIEICSAWKVMVASMDIEPVRAFGDYFLPDESPIVLQELEALKARCKGAVKKDAKWHVSHLKTLNTEGVGTSSTRLPPEVRGSPWMSVLCPRSQRKLGYLLQKRLHVEFLLPCETIDPQSYSFSANFGNHQRN